MLSGAELWALCGTSQVLADEQELRWCNSKTEARQRALTKSILVLLTTRNLVLTGSPDGAPDSASGPLASRVLLAPALALVVAARRQPAVAVIGVGPDGSARNTPRMFGLAGDSEPVRAVVFEHISAKPLRSPVPVGPAHRFSLLSPAKEGHVLASWAASTGKNGGLLRRTPRPRLGNVVRWRPAGQLTIDRLAVAGDGEPFLLTYLRPGAEPAKGVPSYTSDLAHLLTKLLTEE